MQGARGPGQLQFAWPPLTRGVRALLIAMGVGFALGLLLSLSPELRRAVPSWLGLDARRWGESLPLVPLWQVVTYGFLHSDTGLSHLLFNLLGLYFFGTMLEGLIGTRRFLTQFFAATMAGAVVHLVASAVGRPGLPVVGASGAVLALVCAAAVQQPRRTVFLLFLPVPLWALASLVVAGDLVGVLTSFRDGGGSVAHWVHLGGAAWGGLAAWRRWIWADPIARWQRQRAARAAVDVVNEEAAVDALLAKIQREGISSLDRRERALLKRASARRRS